MTTEGCDIARIPQHLLLKIVNNLSDESLLRFLQTCHSAENFIFYCGPKIRKRPQFNKKLYLEEKPKIATVIQKSSLKTETLIEMEAEINKRTLSLNPYPAFSNPLFFQWLIALNHQRFRAPGWIPRKLQYSDCCFEVGNKLYRFNGAQLKSSSFRDVEITEISHSTVIPADTALFYPAHIVLVDIGTSLLFLKAAVLSAMEMSSCEVGNETPEVRKLLNTAKIGKIFTY